MPGSEPESLKDLARKLAIATLLAAAALSTLEGIARRAPTSFRLKRLGVETAAPSIQTLALGPSVAFNGFDPAVLKVPGYNFADNAQTLYYDRCLLEQWAPRMPRLHTVLLGLAYASLRTSVDSLSETARAFAYRREFGVSDECPEDRWDLRNYSAALALGPLNVLEWRFWGRGLVLGDVSPNGFGPLPSLPPDQVDLQLSPLAGQEEAFRQGSRMTLKPSYGLSKLRAMLGYCAQHRLRACVFVPPVTQAFAQAVDASTWARDRSAVKRLCDEHGAAFFDYFENRRFKDEDFADVDHLAAPAADKFTRLLARDAGLDSDNLPKQGR